MRSRLSFLLAPVLVLLGPLVAGAQLTISNLTGFGATSPPNVSITLGSSTNDYDICSALQATGVDPAVTRDGRLTLALSNGVIVGATSSSAPAMQSGDCGSSWQPGWSVTVVVASGESARIQGAGGKGGNGDLVQTLPPEFKGGGGGGAGTVAGSGGLDGGSAGTATAGGAGGPTTNPGSAIVPRQDGSAGGAALEATDGGPDITLAPASGATLEVWSGGGGGGGSSSNTFSGGAGGGPGLAGDAALAGGAGGAAGAAYSEPGSASIIEGGEGTIEKLGG